MKKFTLLIALMMCFVGFSQTSLKQLGGDNNPVIFQQKTLQQTPAVLVMQRTNEVQLELQAANARQLQPSITAQDIIQRNGAQGTLSNGLKAAQGTLTEQEQLIMRAYTLSQNRNPEADFVPVAGATETFAAAVGDNLYDPGGPGVNYPNCDCITVSTLDGATEIEFLEYELFLNFDWLAIYDGTDTSGTILWNSGPGGANENADDLADMIAQNGSTIFSGTSGALTLEFRASAVVDGPGFTAMVTATGGGGGGGMACSESAPSNMFEQGYINDPGSGFITANDVTVSADENFTLNQMTLNLFHDSGATITNVNIMYHEDAGGLPGAMIGSETVTPTSQAVIGANFGFDVSETIIDVTPFQFIGQAGADTTYWIATTVETSSNGIAAWESQFPVINGNITASFTGGGWGLVTGGEDGVYIFSGDCVSTGGGGGMACEEVSPSNAFENAVFSGDGPMAPLQIIAGDVTVAADEDFTLNTINANLWANVGAGDVASAEIVIFGDAGGVADPGNVIATLSGVVPTSQTLLGQNGTGLFDVYDVEFDAGGVLLAGQAGTATTYWLSIYMTMTDGGDGLWELTTAGSVGIDLGFSSDGGVTWGVFAGNEVVYTWSGDCEPIGGGGPDCTSTAYDSTNVPFDIDGADTTTADCVAAPNLVGVNVAEIGIIGTDADIESVVVDITHTWSGDLELSLVSPAGTELILADNLTGNTDDAYNGTTFEDGGLDIVGAATTGVQFGVGPYQAEGGTFATTFAGEDITGDWSLKVCDTANGDSGQVLQFTLNLCVPDQPNNDECVDAFPIACGDVVVGETTSDTDSGGNAAPDEWYAFTGTGDVEIVTVSLCDGGTDFDTFLRVFDACGGAQIAASDDACGVQSEVEFVSDGTSTYYIMVEGFGTESGNFSMAVTCAEPLANDFCDGAIPVECGDSISGTTIDATLDSDVAPECDTSVTSPGVWYVYQDDNCFSSNITISLCDGGTNFDSKLSVYTGDCGAPPLTCVVGNDDSCGLQSEVTFASSGGGETYYILVHGFGGATGNFSLDIQCAPDSPSNDMIANAIDVDQVGFPYTDANVSLPAATVEGANPTGCNIDGVTGVWYKFTAEGNGTATASVPDPSGTTVVQFYSAPDENAGVTDLTLVPFIDNQCVPGPTAAIPTVEDQAYYVLVMNSGDCTDVVIDGTNLGLGDNVIEGFTYYPNPAKNTINLNAIDTIDSISFFNILGQKVLEQNVGATNSQIDISAFSTGTYVMKVSVNGELGTYKIIKE